MNNPTFRALCAELVDALAEWQLGGGPPEDTADADLINRALAALAQTEPESAATQLAARPLLEKVARMAGCSSSAHRAISDQAAAWLDANPPGQPIAIEPRGCPTPGACSCIEPVAQTEPQRKYCPFCEGTPVASNFPCAVCGRAALAQSEPVAPTDEEPMAAARKAVDTYPRVSELPYFLDEDSSDKDGWRLVCSIRTNAAGPARRCLLGHTPDNTTKEEN